MELGEEFFAGAWGEFDRGDDVDHGVTALGEGALAPLREARIRLVRNSPRLRRGVEAVMALRAISVWCATPGRSPGLKVISPSRSRSLAAGGSLVGRRRSGR